MSTTALQMLYITSCTDPLMWYSDRVGQFVPLLRRLPEGGWGSQEPDGHKNIVKALDAEEVVVLVPTDTLGQWPDIRPVHKLVHIVRKDVAERAKAWTPPKLPEATPTPTACKDRCDMLGVCRGLPSCEERLGTSRVERAAHRAGELKDLFGEVGSKVLPAGQSRWASLTETVTNLVIGFVISVLITAAVLPWYGHAVTMQDNIEITAIFTLASLVRTYALRRFFNLFSSRS